MDPIKVALRDIRHGVDSLVIDTVFKKPEYLNDVNSAIVELVIRDKVIPDIGLHGYNLVNLPITEAVVHNIDTESYTLHYSYDRLDRREIIGVYGIYDIYSIGSAATPPVGNTVGDLLAYANDVTAAIPPLFNTQCTIVGRNTILVRGTDLRITPEIVVNVNLQPNNDANTLTPQQVKLFSKLCVLAVKNYCYINNRSKQSISPAFGGIDSSTIGDTINDYSSAMEEYMELLETKWGKVTILEDGITHSKLIQMQIAPDL